MHYAYPHLLGLSALALGAAVLTGLALYRRRAALRRLAAAPAGAPILLVNRPLQLVKALFVASAAALLALVVLGPEWGRGDPGELPDPARGRDVLIVLDVSRSMLADDVPDSRLAQARRALEELTEAVQRRGGHRLALVAVAARAQVLCPLTQDFDHFREKVAELNVEELAGVVGPKGREASGTRLGAGISHSVARSAPKGGPRSLSFI